MLLNQPRSSGLDEAGADITFASIGVQSVASSEFLSFVNIVVMWIVLTRESVTAGVSGRIDKGTEKRLEMMWCQHVCHSCKEQEVYNAVKTTHCATETIDTPFAPKDS